jgi:hypothetical protein
MSIDPHRLQLEDINAAEQSSCAHFSLRLDAAPQHDGVSFVEIIRRNRWKQRKCKRIVSEYS